MLVNLTGHPVILRTPHNNDITLPEQGRVRLVSTSKRISDTEINYLKIPRYLYVDQRIVGLPEPQEGVIYIVSGVVADHARREDVWTVGKKIAVDGLVTAGQALVRWVK